MSSGDGMPVILVVVGVVGLVGLSLLGRTCCTGPEQTRAAKQEATKWAHDLGLKVTGISCADIDTDNDGYVSCTLALEGGATKQIECRGAYSWGHGCRDPKLTIPTQR